MPDRWQTHSFEFKGGLITNLSPYQQGFQAPGSARILRNFEPSIFGGYRRVEGFSKFDTNAVTNTGVIRGIVTKCMPHEEMTYLSLVVQDGHK